MPADGLNTATLPNNPKPSADADADANANANDNKRPTLITVFTGFLGSGKTSIILNLLSSQNANFGEKISVLKNEFGDNEIDSKLFQLRQESSISAVKEMLNGCMCCVLVGQMKNALLELKDLNDPDRIIIETSGSAFPAPIAWQIREMDQSLFQLDSIITVVDCVNFKGYEDTSYTAKMQAQYTDLILLNKYELVTERELDLVLDSVNDLNTDTPKLKWGKECADTSLLFNLSVRPFTSNITAPPLMDQSHHSKEIDLIHITVSEKPVDLAHLESGLAKLDKEYVYRVKGVLNLSSGSSTVLNWAFGRWSLTDLPSSAAVMSSRVTVMGVGLKRFVPVFQELFVDGDCHFVAAVKCDDHCKVEGPHSH